MSQLLLLLRDVPDDEQAEVHALLQAHTIDYYQSQGSVFGVSAPALWLRDESQLSAARELLDRYAIERQQRMQQWLASERQAGRARTVGGLFTENPLRFVVCLALAGGMVYLATVQFWLMMS